jgi:plastocyanin
MDEFSQLPQQYQSWPVEPQPTKKRLPYKTIAVVAVLALAITGSAVWASQRPGEAPKLAAAAAVGEVLEEEDEGHTYEAVVSITADGIVPSTIRVKPGTRVYFENKDSQPHSVTVTSAPDRNFGSEDSIPAGSGYAFSFQKTGTYSFYDWAAPAGGQSGGQIIVEK